MALKQLFDSNNLNNVSINIYANKINTKELDVENVDINNAVCENLEVTNSTILNGTVNIKNSIFPDNTTTAGWVLTNVDGAGNLQWAPDGSSGMGDVSFVDTPPTQINEVCLYGSTDGQGIKKSNILSSNLFLRDGTSPMTGSINVNLNNINNCNNLQTVNLVSWADPTTAIETSNNRIDIRTGNITMSSIGNNINFQRATQGDGSSVTFSGFNGSYSMPTSHNGLVGAVLMDVTGSGQLSFALPPSGVSLSGKFTPSITISSGSVLLINDAIYTRINNIVNYSGSVVVTLPASGKNFNLNISFPPSSSSSGLDASAIANGGFDNNTANIFCYGIGASGGQFILSMQGNTYQTFVGGTSYIQYNISFESFT